MEHRRPRLCRFYLVPKLKPLPKGFYCHPERSEGSLLVAQASCLCSVKQAGSLFHHYLLVIIRFLDRFYLVPRLSLGIQFSAKLSFATFIPPPPVPFLLQAADLGCRRILLCSRPELQVI
jgi:hypothetical protein